MGRPLVPGRNGRKQMKLIRKLQAQVKQLKPGVILQGRKAPRKQGQGTVARSGVRGVYVYIYIYMVTPPMIRPSLLVNCSSAVLCLRMLSPKSINHRYLRGFLHFTYTDLCLLCSFSGILNHSKPKPESGSVSTLKHLSPSQLRKTKEIAVVFPQLVLFSVIRNPVS